MKHIDARDYVVLMDERGKDITSEALAKSRGRRRRGTRGHRSPWADPPRIRRVSSGRKSPRSMVMNHQVARIVLLEQLYRAWTILRGEPYHH